MKQDPTRLKILRHIQANPKNQFTVDQLAADLGLSKSQAARVMADLHRAGNVFKITKDTYAADTQQGLFAARFRAGEGRQ